MSILLELLGFRATTSGSRSTNNNSRGFTLVELLVVIAIISVLATLLLLQLGVARAKARDAKRIADVNQVRSALELYFDDNGSYMATNLMTALEPTYLNNVPHDPIAAGCTDTYAGTVAGNFNCYGYAYNPAASPARMQVWAQLEQANANALGSDTDINSTVAGWNGGTMNGATEACTTAASDCIYDSGQP